MKFLVLLAALVAAVVVVECTHTFLGTNVLRRQVYHSNAKYSSYMFQKRVEKLKINVPPNFGYATAIQGILAYDKTNSKASANVTEGGLGFNYVTLRMKSERGGAINYDVYVYV